jgi:uncharacterized protein HemY
MGKNETLIQALRAAVAATPENAALRKHLGDLLLEAGDFTAATQEYRQALDAAQRMAKSSMRWQKATSIRVR